MSQLVLRILIVLHLVNVCGRAGLAAESDSNVDTIEFNRDVRPILSDKCFHCHGPDAAKREADLRLDKEAGALADLGGYSAVVPGRIESSQLIARITHTDPGERMPPVDSGRSLSSNQIKLLKRWIEQGAKWQKHWSFIPANAPTRPQVRAADWPQNPIDWFVLAQLERAGLKPSRRAEKTTLIRRVTFDLTGLPPTLAEIDAFVTDESSDAFENVVDRLLESQHYGERMTMQWLDAARYADSHGYSLDRRRVMWPWRDWVIWAYNQNMPFDQFTIEQLAGDLLPDATTAQKIATGFNRNHPIQSEGGVINEEYRVETVVDRVETTSAVFLGLTMGCCRCHDHKYEPITQQEFYRFFAFFNNVPESAHVGNSDNQADRPFISAPSVLADIQRRQYQQEITRLKQELEKQTVSASKPRERVWIDEAIPKGAQSLGNLSGEQEFKFVSKPDHPVFSGERSSTRTSKGLGQHLIQNANPGFPVGQNATLFTYVYLDPDNPPKEIMLQWHDGQGWEHRAYWGGNHIPWGKDKSPSRKRIGPLPKAGQWTRLEIDAAEVGLNAGAQLAGWAFTQFDGTVYWDKSGIVDVTPSPLTTRLGELKASLANLGKSKPTAMVMAETTPARKTFVLARGQYDQPTDVEVTAGLPAVLGALPKDAKPNRLALARWLIDPSNPLTARVAVNRYWQMYFGTGLVKTPEDFGTQGEPPSHPQLLDWLAIEFVRSSWNVKAMQKLIVMSATYQQSSKVTSKLLQADPNNQLLARGPRFRFPAELIRDNALAVSGLLVNRLGGASVRPYQPPGLWDDVVYQNVPRFQQDHGDKLYRRSMYTYWKRSVPPPNLQAFDAPSREACVLTRSRTNTPLAALVLMNDPTFVEASRKLAERAMTECDAPANARLTFLFRQTTGRPPAKNELERLQTTWSELVADYREDQAAAEKLMHVGESKYNASLDLAELAAYTGIANALLGIDETITKN
ncbi:MAG: PSD1 and planctomycete cytochrome C domain-containing protein [Pirellulales bacterium]